MENEVKIVEEEGPLNNKEEEEMKTTIKNEDEIPSI